MPRLSDRLRGPLTRRYQTALATVVTNATPTLHRLWDGLPAYDEANVEALTVAAKAPLQAVKTASVRHSLGYYTTLAGVRPPVIKPDEVAAVADMRDPFISVWQALKSGNPYEAALLAGRSRVEAVVSNFVNSTSRQTGDLFVAKAKLETAGWERITNRGACAWCQLVSTQRYKTADSADFGHDRCGCTAVPIFGDSDPGRVVNRDLLQKLKADGVVDKISLQKALPRARAVLTNAEQRVVRLRAEIARETDQVRETRLERRLDKALQDVKARKQRVADLER